MGGHKLAGDTVGKKKRADAKTKNVFSDMSSLLETARSPQNHFFTATKEKDKTTVLTALEKGREMTLTIHRDGQTTLVVAKAKYGAQERQVLSEMPWKNIGTAMGVFEALLTESCKARDNLDALLLSAVIKGDNLGVEDALRKGASVNVTDKRNRSVLRIAATKRNAAITRTLISAGAWEDGLDLGFLTAPRTNAGMGRPRPWYGGGALVRAILDGNDNKTYALIAARKDINLQMQSGTRTVTPLACAVQTGNIALVDTLIAAGADIIHAMGWDNTLLELAALNNDIDMIRTLLLLYAKANRPEWIQWTEYIHELLDGALMNACTVEMAEILIEAGASVNAKNRSRACWTDDWTVLMHAIGGQHPDDWTHSGLEKLVVRTEDIKNLVEFLISKGARIDVKAKDEAGPHGEIIAIQPTPLMLVSDRMEDNAELAQVLINALEPHQRKVYVNAMDETGHNWSHKHGWTALMYAAEAGEPRVVDVLINEGANVNATDKEGVTALKIAMSKNNGHDSDFYGNAGKWKKVSDLLREAGAKECGETCEVNR